MTSLADLISAFRSMPNPDLIVQTVRLEDLARLQDALRRRSVTFAMPAYEEGAGIVVALDALQQAKDYVGLADAPILVSDSSSSSATVDAAREWAAGAGATVEVDYSRNRRSLKQALNGIFDRVSSALLVVTVADVFVAPAGLADLLAPFLGESPPDVTIGASLPDPHMRSLSRRAGAWQTRAVWRAIAALPETTVRADGALWAMGRRFIDGYRFPIGAGSIADDAELAAVLRSGEYRACNIPTAVAYHVPPGSYADFRSRIERSRFANPGHRRFAAEYAAGVAEALSDPLGAICYAAARVRMLASRRHSKAITETWTSEQSTKR